MPHYTYVIVGGGMTADAAVRGIRAVDGSGSVVLLSAEPDPPYDRPPLSKALWRGAPEEGIWRGTAELGAELHLGRRAVWLDPAGKRVRDDAGTEYTYEKLLLATGGTPRRLPFGGDLVVYFRTLGDYRRLRSLAEERERFVVIGGGFIGSELAAALAMNGKRVTMLFPEAGIGAGLFPADLSAFLNDYYAERGVEVRAGAGVVDVRAQGAGVAVVSADGREVEAEGVVAGIGIRPETELAAAAGLPVADGIEVDEWLRAGHPDIYAAGDVARFFQPALGKRVRIEHEDNANTQGQAAGRAMAGEPESYRHLPFFYSDLFDLGYEAVGELDPRLETVADWKEPYREGVVYYLESGRVRGVLLWNTWGQVDAARRLIAEPGPFRAADLIGRLPE